MNAHHRLIYVSTPYFIPSLDPLSSTLIKYLHRSVYQEVGRIQFVHNGSSLKAFRDSDKYRHGFM